MDGKSAPRVQNAEDAEDAGELTLKNLNHEDTKDHEEWFSDLRDYLRDLRGLLFFVFPFETGRRLAGGTGLLLISARAFFVKQFHTRS